MYISRCVLVEFATPCIDITMANYAQLSRLLKISSSSIGEMIGLGRKFLEIRTTELNNDILPNLHRLVDASVVPRVLFSYGILLWFAKEVCNSKTSADMNSITCLLGLRIAQMNFLMKDVFKHFQLKMVSKILLLQSQENLSHSISGNQHHSPDTMYTV